MRKIGRIFITIAILVLFAPAPAAGQADANGSGRTEYLLLATNRTSTMEKEMNQAAGQGYRFAATMGGETAFGGSESVVVMGKATTDTKGGMYVYRLLATQRTSTMQKELNQASEEGFRYRGQTVFEVTLGGKEVVVILERDADKKEVGPEYRLLATSKTSTMQKELQEAGQEGFSLVGLTVGETAFGGKELVAIMIRAKR